MCFHFSSKIFLTVVLCREREAREAREIRDQVQNMTPQQREIMRKELDLVRGDESPETPISN